MAYKTKLNEFCQKNHLPSPLYVCTNHGSTDKAMFAASVTVNDEAFRVPATFNTKKEAMNDVARIAYGFLSI